MCEHEAWTGVGRIQRAAKWIRFVMVCEECGAEQREIFAGPYDPHLTEIPDDVMARRLPAGKG
jgi:hypothetical protein